MPNFFLTLIILLFSQSFYANAPGEENLVDLDQKVKGEFVAEVENTYRIRNSAPLLVTNLRGNVEIHGWALDRVKVVSKTVVNVTSHSQVDAVFKTMGSKYNSKRDEIEISAEYGKGLGIRERLIERENPKGKVDMIVHAPANLKLRVLTRGGSAAVNNWKASVEVRTLSGEIIVNRIFADSVAAMCANCKMKVRSVRASFRGIVGAGEIDVSSLRSNSVYLESKEGAQRIKNVRSKQQLYVATDGKIFGEDLNGNIEFRTEGGDVQIEQSRGFISGVTASGHIKVAMREWEFSDKAFLESETGNIHLSLPSSFAGFVDLRSNSGLAVLSKFILNKELPEKNPRPKPLGPDPAGLVRGQIGDGGDEIKLYSRRGNVEIAQR